jgi:DNA recombination protein RmuC
MLDYMNYILMGIVLSIQILLFIQLKKYVAFKSLLLEVQNNILENSREILRLVSNCHSEQINLFTTQISSSNFHQKTQLEQLNNSINEANKLTELKLENIRNSVEDKLHKIQNDNNEKLERMRQTVEEKLHDTLEKRLGESFKIVSDRLEQVHKGLGEMQNLANGVGDLKKVLSNVKTRGIWGEVQLEAILEQILTPNQYIKNSQITKNSQERVDFAIKLPNKDGSDEYILLPLDSKFPMDIYQKLIFATETNNLEEIETARKELDIAIKTQAKKIAEKYIIPPHSTDFAIMFLPIEGLYAESLRSPGMIEELQRNYKVIVTGPTTFTAILNSLQMGFRTLAIEKRTSEVWKILSTVKSEFIKFADILSKTRVKLDQASRVIGDAEVRTRAIQRQLKEVEVSTLDNIDSSLSPKNDNEILEDLEEASNE